MCMGVCWSVKHCQSFYLIDANLRTTKTMAPTSRNWRRRKHINSVKWISNKIFRSPTLHITCFTYEKKIRWLWDCARTNIGLNVAISCDFCRFDSQLVLLIRFLSIIWFSIRFQFFLNSMRRSIALFNKQRQHTRHDTASHTLLTVTVCKGVELHTHKKSFELSFHVFVNDF